MTTSTTTPLAPSTRPYQGTVVPTAGVYDLDQAHTTVEFVARHLMITKVRGRFATFSGSVNVAEVPEESSVEVTIDAASIQTSQEQRDAHLRSADFFDAEKYPTLSFKSTAVALDGDNWKVTGDLTVRDVTRPVVLDVEFDGANTTPVGHPSRGVLGFDRDRPRRLGPDLQPDPRDRRRGRGQEGPHRAQRRGGPASGSQGPGGRAA